MRTNISVENTKGKAGDFDDPNNQPTVPWDGDTLHYMGGECEEVRFGFGRTLVYLHNPQMPSQGVCRARDNASALGKRLETVWNSWPELVAACMRVRDGLDAGEHPGKFAAILDAALAAARGEREHNAD